MNASKETFCFSDKVGKTECPKSAACPQSSPSSKKQNVPNKERGFILLSVIVAMTLVAAVAFMLGYQGASQTGIVTGELERDQLRYVAEAGMAHAKMQLAKNTSCEGYTDIPKTDFAGESYSAAFSSYKNSPVTVIATGLLQSGAELSLQSDAIRIYQPPNVVSLRLDKTAGKDTHIDSFYANANYGSHDDLTVRSASSWIQRPLLEFDLTKIPSGVKIISAQLKLQQRTLGTAGVIGVHRVTRGWEEGTGKGTGNADGATWNEYDGASAWVQPGGDFDPALYAAAATTSAKSGGWVSWDIPDLVQEWVSGQYLNYGLTLVGDGVVDNAEFESREESDPTLAPTLTIAYACECGQVCGSGPGKLLLVVGNAISPVGKDSDRKTLMESWGYIVTLIDDNDSQANFDDATAMNDVIYATGSISASTLGTKLTGSAKPIVNERRSMIVEFGFSDAASDSLVSDSYSATDATHYITEPFLGSGITHFTSSITIPVPSGTLAPGLHSVASSGTVYNGLPTLEAGAMRWDGTPAAARRVQVPFESADISQLTADGLTLMRRAIEWGAGASVAGNDVLLVVGDPASLTPEQADKKALMEGWGHTISLIAADDTQANFDIAAALVDVVYVPELGADPMGDLGAKADNLAKGVITEEARKPLLLGSFSLFPFVDTDTIDITDNTHYITETLPTGNVQLSTTVQSMWVLKGTLAPELHVLGEMGGTQPGLAYLEAGELLNDGNPAPARRVKLPWGAYEFDVNSFTDDARTIMKRAIEWGAGTAAGVGPKKVLFVVGRVGGAGPTAEELAHQALIESWGHTVELIDDDATQAEFDTAAAANDVAFMTNDITASRLGTKLVDTTIGVVTSEDNLSDEFGMASSIAWESGTVVEINDNTHYITSPFSTGLLTILSTSESLAYVTGTLSTDLGQLASSTSGYGIVTLDSGASMYGGGSAAGRRVQLPWGGNGFDPNNLSADGLTILQRALEWGAGAGDAAATGLIAHWKLDDGTGLTAVDSAGGHDGTLINGPTWVAGQIGDALHFDGTNDYVDAGTFDVSGGGLTLTAWFNADTIPTSDGRFISKAVGANAADAWWQLSTTDVGANRFLRTRIKAGGTTTTFADSSVNLTTGRWYFAAATYDNSGAMKLYLDGVEVASGSHAAGGPIDADPSVPVAIGANGTAERFFDGVLDDVRVYNYALDATEIADLFTSGGGGGGGGGGSAPVFESFEEYRDADNSSASIAVAKPAGTAAGDLLVAVVVTNRNNETTLVADDPGWTLLTRDRQASSSTTGVWWKLAGDSEPSSYGFSWDSANPGRSYSWIMRFSGNDPTNPINVWGKFGECCTNSPLSPAVSTTVDDTLILRIGGFDDDDITVGDPGMAGHTPITMQESNSGTGTVSGGAAYVEQAASGDSGTANFTLTATEQSRTITIGIAPEP